MHLIEDERLRAQLARLYERSEAQKEEIYGYFAKRIAAQDLSWDGLDQDAHDFFADKFVALDRDKAEFCHALCLAMGATRIVEVGTSFGVSTLFLADAVRANGGGLVVATEHEPDKAKVAHEHYAEAGLDQLIELREGDLRQTLQRLEGPIDFVLMDIWTEMIVPAIELIAPHLRRGATIVADNTIDFKEAYEGYFSFLEENGFSTQTLPFEGGLELSIKR